jgi:hypothetical protein
VNGTVNGCRVRVTIAPGDGGWAFPLSPSRMRDQGFEVGAEVMCELAPEGPQRGDLADDIAAALEDNPAAGAFFDTLAQFYRKAYLRYIDATTRRPDVRAARIAEVTELCARGVKERPRSLQQSRNSRKHLASHGCPGGMQCLGGMHSATSLGVLTGAIRRYRHPMMRFARRGRPWCRRRPGPATGR